MIAYLDMPAGISGDMLLGCLIDAGWPIERLRAVLAALHLPAGSWSVEAKHVMKGAVRATLADVKVFEATPASSSIMGRLPPAASIHRNLDDIRQIIHAADLPQRVKDLALAVFLRLASAEAKVHREKIDNIHFHEIGGLDAIVDIVGTCAGLHELGIDDLYASTFSLSSGWVETAHGRLPLPAPATLEILAGANAPTQAGPGPGELVTPTGAALVCTLAVFTQPPLRLKQIALGAGQRNARWPNLARLWLGEAELNGRPPEARRELVQLDTNIDDMNPQVYPSVMEELFKFGALDVWLTPVQMKKGRPAICVSVLADRCDEPVLANLLLRHTTTLGVRVHQVRRHEANREIRRVITANGPIRVKLKWVGKELVGITPEYEDCRDAAARSGMPVQVVLENARMAAHEAMKENTPARGGISPALAPRRFATARNTMMKRGARNGNESTHVSEGRSHK